MELVYSWLKEYVDVDLPIVDLAHALTMLGMEVENVRLLGYPKPDGGNTGISFHGLEWDPEKFVVARVDEVMAHPNADRLVLCRLFDGKDELSVLTGAPNLYPYKGKGPLAQPLKVAYAREAAKLYDGHKSGQELTTLKRLKIRGVESFSMICSEKELGISEEHEGVIILDSTAPEGTPLVEYMGDAVFEIAILPNMVHCANVIGVAREVAAYLKKPLKFPDTTLLSKGPSITDKISIKIINADLNPRFVVGLLQGVKAQPSPYWVQYRLQLAGMRPINSIVDATNYVMLEAGEPLHAFDYDVLLKRAGGETPKIITRTARKGEKLTTLDDVERELDDFTELVCDSAGALSIAGVMGGLESEVTDQTTNVLLEGASWNFINIRKTVASQRLNSEASYRFSRNVHPALAETGVRIGLQRMAAWSGGTIAEGLVDEYPTPRVDPIIVISESDVERILGIQLKAKEIAVLLERLDFVCTIENDLVNAQSPAYRTDIGKDVIGKADVIEEVARLFGFENIPPTRLQAELPPQRGNRSEERDRLIQDTLANLGLQEVISYRLTSPESELRLYPAGSEPEVPQYVEIQNPIAVEKRVLRRSLIASVVEALERNIRHQERLLLFEIGPVFLPNKDELLPDEPARLAIALSGLRHPNTWDQKGIQLLDFFDLKGILEALLDALHIKEYVFTADTHPSFHPGKCALLSIGEDQIGWMGELHPKVKENYSFLEAPVLAAEIDLDMLFTLSPKDFVTTPLAAYPPVIEDLAMIVPEGTTSAEIEKVILSTGGILLKQVNLFDIFRGEQIGAGNKSMAYRLTYQAPNRTLTDNDVGKLRIRIINQLEKELGVIVRKAD
ncbi:MAG: phenylalanine--tRNA ligase subunit beta [Pelolinea sp.]|nr:phenylalanine--tRNA ligase subunit beta [Pelolinea sp.]